MTTRDLSGDPGTPTPLRGSEQAPDVPERTPTSPVTGGLGGVTPDMAMSTSGSTSAPTTETMYAFLRQWLTQNNIPIAHTVENFNALINTFYGRTQDGVWAEDLMSQHFEAYRNDDGTIDPQAAEDINQYLAGIGVEGAFDAAPSDDSGPVTGAPSGPPPTSGPGTEQVGTDGTYQELPKGLRLVRVTNPAGSDAAALYYVVGDVYGAQIAYEVGDEDRLNELFGGVAAFDAVTTQTQTQFDASDALVVGDVDEIAGSTESLQAQYERDMRAVGLEAPPSWIQNDQTALATFVTGVNEGWSAERTWGELSKLDSFKERFSGFDTVQGQLGTTSVQETVAEYLNRENEIRQTLLRFRGPNTNVSNEYLSSLIGSGWQVTEVYELAELEAEVRGNQEALANINEILAYQGLEPLTADQFVDYLASSKSTDAAAPSEIFEAVNDALRKTALEAAGLDVSAGLAESLGTGVSFDIESPTAFNDKAQYVAGVVAANADALDLQSYGLNRDSVLQFFLGQSDDPDVGRKLEKLGRERGIAAQGFDNTTAFIDSEGRLRAQGLADI